MCPYLNKDSVILLLSLYKKPMKFIEIIANYNQDYLVRVTDVIFALRARCTVTDMKSFPLEPQLSLEQEQSTRANGSPLSITGVLSLLQWFSNAGPHLHAVSILSQSHMICLNTIHTLLKTATVIGRAMLNLQCFGVYIGFLINMV